MNKRINRGYSKDPDEYDDQNQYSGYTGHVIGNNNSVTNANGMPSV
jgi:hypothetical protein